MYLHVKKRTKNQLKKHGKMYTKSSKLTVINQIPVSITLLSVMDRLIIRYMNPVPLSKCIGFVDKYGHKYFLNKKSYENCLNKSGAKAVRKVIRIVLSLLLIYY